MIVSIVSGATNRGCDLLGELAENLNTDAVSVSSEDKENEMGTSQKTSQASLRRSLSLVLLSELATTRSASDNDSSKIHNAVKRDSSGAEHRSSTSCFSNTEQHSVDNDLWQDHVSDVSSDDCSDIEILPLSQRLQMNNLQTDLKISGRRHTSEELPLFGSNAASRRDKVENCCVNQSSQRVVKSDSATLPSTRREALKLRAASVISDDDIFLDSAVPTVSEYAICHSQSTEIEKITPKTNTVSCSDDAYVFECSDLSITHQENTSEIDIARKFQNALHISDNNEILDLFSTTENCFPEQYEVRESSGELFGSDDSVETADLSVAGLKDKSSCSSCRQLDEKLMWSPRHFGNFSLETSVLNTPSVDFSEKKPLQFCNTDNLSSGSKTSTYHPEGTDNNNEACNSVVSTSCKMSDFVDPVLDEENAVLSLSLSEDFCNISIFETDVNHCCETDYSCIVID